MPRLVSIEFSSDGPFGITDARISNLGVNEELSRTTFAALQRD